MDGAVATIPKPAGSKCEAIAATCSVVTVVDAYRLGEGQMQRNPEDIVRRLPSLLYDPTGTYPEPKPHLGCHCERCEPLSERAEPIAGKWFAWMLAAIGFVLLTMLATGKLEWEP